MSTLMDFRYKRKYAAENGADGSGGNRSGKDGKDMVIRVPNGTVILDKASGKVIADMSDCGSFRLLRGGNGGWGNRHFATPTRQAPRFAKAGLRGEELEVVLELKMIADVGIIGYPNVGKSTLLAAASEARPKIAGYHFTTLYPNLGVISVDQDSSFIMADIPGIIEGASEGAGLGHDFLRHIERCRLLVHVVDISGGEGRDPAEDFETVNKELRRFNPELSERPQLIAANKCDAVTDEGITARFEKYVAERGYKLRIISAAARTGLRELLFDIANTLKALPPVAVYEPEYTPVRRAAGSPDDLSIEAHGDIWTIEGEWLERLVANTNFSDVESKMFFEKTMRNAGVYRRLEEMGISEGDTVSIYNLEFEYAK